jgi:hypothetical protein
MMLYQLQTLYSVKTYGRLTVNEDQSIVELTIASFKVLFESLFGGAEENHHKFVIRAGHPR